MSIRIMLKLVAVLSVFCSSVAVGQDKNGLVAHWRFDEGKGAIARDASGNGNDATIHGAKFVKFGKGFALRFDGVDDYVDCGAGEALNIEAGGTVVLWFRLEALQGALVARTTGREHRENRLLLGFRNCFETERKNLQAEQPLP